MERFIKLRFKTSDIYSLTDGMDGCIVRLKEKIGSLAVVHAPDLGAYCKPENRFLAKPLDFNGSPNDYFFSQDMYEEVENPFTHWNRLKSVGIGALQ